MGHPASPQPARRRRNGARGKSPAREKKAEWGYATRLLDEGQVRYILSEVKCKGTNDKV